MYSQSPVDLKKTFIFSTDDVEDVSKTVNVYKKIISSKKKSKTSPSFTSKTVTTLDLNGPFPGNDYSLDVLINFIYQPAALDWQLVTTSGSFTSATITFSQNPTGAPNGVYDNGQERLVIYNEAGTGIISAPFLGNTSNPAPFGPFNVVYGTNSFTITSVDGITYNITETNGNPILTDNFETFLLNFRYLHQGTGVVTEAIRYMQISVTDPVNALSATTELFPHYPPVVIDDTASLAANAAAPITGNLLSNDTDNSPNPPGNVLSVADVNGYVAEVGMPYNSTYGTLTVQSDGSYSYQVDTSNIAVLGIRNGETLEDIIAYRAADGLGFSDTGFITVTINGVTEPPVATDNANSVIIGSSPTATGNVITDDDGNGPDNTDRPFARFIWENEFSATGGEVGYSPPIDGESRLNTTTGVTISFTSTDPDNVGTINRNQVVHQTRTNGGHTGYLGYQINGTTNPVASTTTTIDFDAPIVSLSFAASDIDQDQSFNTTWQDQFTVTAFLDGVPVAYNAQVAGTVIQSGNSFYGTGSVPASEAMGNVNFFFPDPINQVVIEYNYGPDVIAPDPNGQIAAITDLIWQATDVPRVSEVDNDTANVGNVIATTYGFITVNSDGSYTYNVDPANPAVVALSPGSTLTDTIPYQLIDSLDNSGATSDANLIITIIQPAQAVANDDDFSSSPINGTSGGTTATVFGNDTSNADPANDANINDNISITNDGGLTGITINTDGTINVPPGTAGGSYTVTYQICLNSPDDSVCDSAIVTIEVFESPVAQDDVSVDNNVGVTVFVNPFADNGSGIDSDPDGSLDPTSVSLVVPSGVTMIITDSNGDFIGFTVPGEGTWEVNPINGEISFTPETGFNGSPTPIQYTVDDNDGYISNPAFVTIIYNIPPVADDEILSNQTINTPITVDALAGDDDPDGDNANLIITEVEGQAISVGSPVTLADGTVVELNPDGTLNVIPATDSTEPISFEYTVADEDGLTDTGMVDITFTQLPPVADDESLTDQAINTPININVLDGDDDPDGDNANLTITEIIDPATGVVTPIAPGSTVTLSDGTTVTLQTNGTLDVTPATDSTEPISFEYTLEDEDGLTDTGMVDITFTQLPPVADDEILADQTINTPVTVDALAGDDDPDGDNANLTITEVEGQAISVGSPVTLADGTVVELNPDGTLNVIPVTDSTEPISFEYTVEDEDGLTDTGMVDITFTQLPPVADDEILSNQTINTPITVDALAGDDDPDGDNANLTITEVEGQAISVGSPVTLADGTVVELNPDGTLNVIPATDSTEPISFEYTVADEDGLTDTGMVDITFTQLPPVADDESLTDQAINTPININVLDGDDDPDGDNANLTITEIIDPATGVVTPIAPGSTVTLSDGTTVTLQTNGTLDVTPATDSTEPISFEYTLEDEDGLTDTGMVDITFTQLPPVADDEILADQTINTPVTVDALAGDDDPDGDNANLTITEVEGQAISVGSPVTLADGTVVELNPDGTLNVIPVTDSTEPISFEYTVADEDGLTDTGMVDITFTQLPPVADDEILSNQTINTPITVDALAGDDDPDGDNANLTITEVEGQAISVGSPVTLADGTVVELIQMGP
ncbi:hypothetical protein BST91_09195 [Nonlabens tegetincola]|nr:hypothetical protein BST91_09195 [Nonlabens tegetincola]